MRTDCRICHSDRLELILPLTPTPIGDQFLLTPKHQSLHPIDLYQCQDCGLAQLLYEITPEDIYRDYLYLTSSSVGLEKHFDEYALKAIVSANLRAGDLVVDVGSNDGTLLKSFKRAGMRVCGVEASPAIAEIAEEAGIPTLRGYFDKDLGIGKARLITANNVVANMNDLDAFMEGVVDLLAPDGTLIFESFYLGDVVKNMVFDFIYHEHLSAFSIKPIKRLLNRYGLGLYRVDRVPTKGGSIRYYCNLYYARRGAPEVEDDDQALYEANTYRDFRRRIAQEKASTVSFLEVAGQGKRIAAFGASISCTTLEYHFGLSSYIDYIVDDNPAKIGRFSPGHHIQVYSTEKLYADRPDYVLALAWRFAEDFRRKHPSFPLIVPLPSFQCIPSS